jgi:hypothetical protein
MFIGYSTTYDMTMLALVSCVNILLEWKYPLCLDSILKHHFLLFLVPLGMHLAVVRVIACFNETVSYFGRYSW